MARKKKTAVIFLIATYLSILTLAPALGTEGVTSDYLQNNVGYILTYCKLECLQKIWGDMPVTFLISLTLFSIANILLIKSVTLLNQVSNTKHRENQITLYNETGADSERQARIASDNDLIKRNPHNAYAIAIYYLVVILFILLNRLGRLFVLLSISTPNLDNNILMHLDNPDSVMELLSTSAFITLSTILVPNEIAPLFIVMAAAPAAVATINFTLATSMLPKFNVAPGYPSRTVGLVGVLISFVSFMGSLAGIGKLLIDPYFRSSH